MKHKILIQNGVFSEDDENLRNSSIVASRYFDVIECDSILDVYKINTNDVDIYRGSLALGAIFNRHHFIKNDFFNCRKWVPELKKFYINKNYNFVDMERCLDLDFPIFIRPCSGNKSFSGQLFTSKEHFNVEYIYTTVNRNISKYDLCLYAKPKNIKEEYRCVFVNNRIVSACGYLKNGERNDFACPKAGINLAIEISKSSYFNIPNFVIDICKDNDDNYFLLEINSINNSSFYSCDLDAIYEELSEFLNMKT
jgi:transcription elongation factor Elf1